MCFTEKGGWTSQCFENFKKIGVETGGEIISLEEAGLRYPVYKNADWEGSDAIYVNPTSGWGEADKAMQSVMDAAVNEGVSYVEKIVMSLILTDDGGCAGVRTSDGQELRANHVLLCTGAGTAKLLADSAPGNKALQLNGRMVAAGAVQLSATCDPEHLDWYKTAPVFFNGAPHIQGTESLPGDVQH